MDELLKYGAQIAGAILTAFVSIKVAVARIDTRMEAMKAEIADLESEHNKIEAKIDRLIELQHQMNIALTRLSTIIDNRTK